MQTPYHPVDSLRSIRIGLAFLLTGSAMIFTAVVALRVSSALHTHKQHRVDRIHQAILTRADYLKTTASYTDCITEAAKIPAESLFHSSAKNLQDQCQIALDETTLSQVQTLVQAGQFQEAVAALQTISSQNARVQQLTEEWSRHILHIAEGYYIAPDANLSKAIEVASSIQANNPLYIEAQVRIRQWQAEWASNQNYFQTAQAALKANQLEIALLHVQQINHPYWRQQSIPIVNAAYAEMALLDQAQTGQPIDSQPAQADRSSGVEAPQTSETYINVIEVPERLLLPFALITLILVRCRPTT